MRIRLWNAYASNNSGSYTIVGCFETSEQAAAVVAELQPLIDAHHEWEENSHSPSDPSPLQQFASAHGVRTHWDVNEWPQYSEDNRPAIIQLDHQVVVHHVYTTTLPRFFGQWFYHRGGRVEIELNHAHHPVIATFQFSYPSGDPAREDRADRLFVALGNVIAKLSDPDIAPVFRRSREDWSRPQVFVAAVFRDFVAGVKAVQELIQEHTPNVELRVVESPRAKDEAGRGLLEFLA